jgi:predicted phosphate transport protein (TIGR00153 family)
MFLVKKNKQLICELNSFFNITQTVLAKTLDAFVYMTESGVDDHFEILVEEISELERDADDMRQAVEHRMFQQSLLPETREDLLKILEEMDNVPDTCERAVYIIADQHVIPIAEIKGDMLELIKVGIECFKYTLEAAQDFLGKMKNIKLTMQKVNDFEHIGDKLERKMIKKIFRNKMLSQGDRLLQKELVQEIGNICNKSKHSAQKIIIASVKRKI